MNEKQQLSGVLAGKFPRYATLVGLVFLVISAVMYMKDAHHFLPSYLVSYMFFIGLSLGSLFLVMVQHLSRAGWSVVIRRVPEALMRNLPLMAILFLPILLGIEHLYHWAEPGAAAHDHLLQIKAPYLNVPFFVIRAVIYFAAWITISKFFYSRSIRQDSVGGEALTDQMQKRSAVSILVFALTFSFASFDWLMSTEPHWFSTIFGVYVFGNAVLATFCFISLSYLILRQFGILKDIVTVEHFHDLGKFIYGFVIFWAYIAFCQFFLIWYANIPEETFWFLIRSEPSWKVFAIVYVSLHFILPLFLFMSRHAKRHLGFHKFIACMILLACFLDTYFVVMPTFSKSFHLSAADVVSFLAIGGIFIGAFLKRLGEASLIPIKDPYISESVNFKNQ